MRVNKISRAGAVTVLLIAIVFGCWPMQKIEASNINFSQSILPVQFVYLDNDFSIDKIWSNISATDSQYVMKFFDARQKEVLINNNLVSDYANFISVKESRQDIFTSVSVSWAKQGEIMEEIKTVV